MKSEPRFLKGGSAVDDRGVVSFANEFAFSDVRRFYAIENHHTGFIRAWHGHKNESKYLFAAKGSILVCATPVEDWEKPAKDSPIFRQVLSDRLPGVLHIPPGYAHGWMSLTEGAKLLVFSTASLEESLKDDFRFDSRYWDPWKIEER